MGGRTALDSARSMNVAAIDRTGAWAGMQVPNRLSFLGRAECAARVWTIVSETTVI